MVARDYWSFSSVNLYDTCPHAFKLCYVDNAKKQSNAFAEFGSFCHSLLERYFKGKTEFFELLQMYQDEYFLNVVTPYPKFYTNLGEKYYQDGVKYFSQFEGISSNEEVVGVEEEVRTEIKGKKFLGFIDLILRDKMDGQYIVVDHKSKSGFKSKAEKEHYLLQLYLYSLYINEKFGTYPKELRFNMFRKNEIVTERFNEEKLLKAINWFDFTTDLISTDNSFSKKENDFYCNNLCSVRDVCHKE